MNPKQLYLAWLRTTHPQIYSTALRTLTNQPRSLGGLDNDLVQSALAPNIDMFLGDDLTTFTDVPMTDVTSSFDASSINIDPGISSAIDSATSSGVDVFSNIADAVSKVATTYLNTSAQSKLLDINTQRARQGYPPLTANGYPVTASMLAPTSASLVRMERSIAGAATPMNMLAIGGLALLGFTLFSRARR